jgi:WD40 repeat protein
MMGSLCCLVSCWACFCPGYIAYHSGTSILALHEYHTTPCQYNFLGLQHAMDVFLRVFCWLLCCAAGCADKQLRVWNVKSSEIIAEWPGHIGVPYCARWAPRRLLAASACSAVCLWVPSPESVQRHMQPLPQ